MWALSTFLPGHLQDLPPPCSRGFVSEPPGRGLQWVWVQGPRGTEPLRPPRAPAEPEEGCGEGNGQVVGLHLKEPRGRAVWHCSHPPWGSSRAGAAGAGLAERAQATGRHPLWAAGRGGHVGSLATPTRCPPPGSAPRTTALGCSLSGTMLTPRSTRVRDSPSCGTARTLSWWVGPRHGPWGLGTLPWGTEGQWFDLPRWGPGWHLSGAGGSRLVAEVGSCSPPRKRTFRAWLVG